MTQAALNVDPNRRAAARRRVLLGAKVIYGEHDYTLDCTIRDISDTGAKVLIPTGMMLPDDVFLMDPRLGLAHEAHVAWRRYPLIGLEFTATHALKDATSPHLRVIRRLWLEGGATGGS